MRRCFFFRSESVSRTKKRNVSIHVSNFLVEYLYLFTMVNVCQVRPSSSTKADTVLEALIQWMNTRWHHRRPVISTGNFLPKDLMTPPPPLSRCGPARGPKNVIFTFLPPIGKEGGGSSDPLVGNYHLFNAQCPSFVLNKAYNFFIFWVRTRVADPDSDPVFLHGSGSGFQIFWIRIRFQPRFWNKKMAERSLKVIYQKKT